MNCHWCERKLKMKRDADWHFQHPLAATWDHVIPKSRGGKELVRACRHCNGLKGDMMPKQWEKFRSENPRWWELPTKTSNRKPVRAPAVIAAAFAAQNRVSKDAAELDLIEWPWLRELIRGRVNAVGFGPW